MKINKYSKTIILIISIIITFIISGCGSTFEQEKSAPIILYQDSNNNNNNNKKILTHKKINKPKIYFHKSNINKSKINKSKINKNIKIKNNKTKFLFKNKISNNTNNLKWITPTKGKHYENKLITYFTGKPNQAIYSSTNGTVMFSGEGVKPFKNMIIIAKDKSISSVYGNLSEINIKEGQYIKQGIKIGQMGVSSNKKHGTLLFQIRKNGKPIKYNSFLN